MLRKFSIKKSRRVTHQFGFTKNYKNLSVLIRVLIHRARRCRAKTLAVALAGIRRFEFSLLSGRHEMRVFFQILDNLFGNHFALKTTQRALD